MKNFYVNDSIIRVIKISKNNDWLKLKNEYITSSISLRDLADKHGVPADTLMKRANRENWTELRKQAHMDITAKLQQKYADRLFSDFEKALDLLEYLIENRPPNSGTKHIEKHYTKNENGERETTENEWKVTDIVNLLSVLNNILLNRDKLELEIKKSERINW